MNNVTLVGRLTKDPEQRTAGETEITRFSIAVNRPFKNKDGEYEADFLNCVAFGKTGDFIGKYFAKGMAIGLIGRIQTGSYVNQEGRKIYTTDIVTDSAEFVESKKNDPSASDNMKPETKNTDKTVFKAKPEKDFFEETEADDEYPFS